MTPDEHQQHGNRRDEQFWFTAAAVGFNGYLGTGSDIPHVYAILSSTVVSLLALHIILTRWVAGARPVSNPPNYKVAAWHERWNYTLREMKAYLSSLPYIFAELSGTSFYLILVVLSFIGAICKHARS
jgi:hypothetical protein